MGASLDFLMSMHWALKAFRLYGAVHPRGVDAVAGLENTYQRFLAGKPQVQIATRHGRMFVDRVAEDASNLQTKGLAMELEDRGIHALLLYPEATREELQTLLGLMCLKPSQIRDQGGAKKIMEDKGVTHIRILAAQLEDISEGGEITAALLESVANLAAVAGSGGPGGGGPGGGLGIGGGLPGQGGPAGGPGTPPLPPGAKPGAQAMAGADFGSMVTQIRGLFLTMIGAGGGHPDLSGFGAMLQSMGMDSQGVQPGTQGAVRQAISALAPEQQVELFRGAAQMRSGPLRNLFSRLAGAMAAQGMAASYARGSISGDKVAEIADQLKPLAASPEQWGEQLAAALRGEGMSEEQLRELVDILTWENQPIQTKLAKLLEGQRIFEMPVDKVLAFLRELLEAGRNQEFLRVMRHYAGGLTAPAVARRQAVARGFEKIADWADIPGMPTGLLNELMELLSRTYGREKDPDVHQWLSRGVEHILWFWVESGDPGMAHSLFSDLQDVVTELSLPAPWKAQATADLLARLGAPDRVNKVLTQLFTLDRQDAAKRIHPYLRMLGTTAAEHLVERLAEEPDRGRRAYLLEALKACGSIAEAPLVESLKSKEWFVVRNAIIVLAEITSPEKIGALIPLLNHPDTRVAGAAIRAVGRIGGRQAESALIQLLSARDSALQLEVLFILQEMKAKQAIPALVELVKGGKGALRPDQERVREKAIDLLGSMESPSVIPVLGELLVRRKGFFRDTREPLPIRTAALLALARFDSHEAQETLRKVLEDEPKGAERDALNKALTESLAGRSSRV
jgi:HEAT repeat protein